MVSVIIPVYNAEKYLRTCVESVLAQTHTDLEVLLIDDGSTDTSLSLCEEIASGDARIRVIHQQNQGEAGARNTGLDNAKGEQIAFLDADDFWDKHFLEKMSAAQTECDLPICSFTNYYDDQTCKPMPAYHGDVRVWGWPILYNYPIACWRCLFKRSIIEENHLHFTLGRRTGADQEFTFEYMCYVQTISFFPDAVYFYRKCTSSVMHRTDDRHFDAVEAMKAVEHYAMSVCPPERATLVSDALHAYKYPQILVFATLTLLTAGETPAHVRAFLTERGYDVLLTAAAKAEKHYEHRFLTLWKISPWLCLRIYGVRKAVGRVMRRRKI